MMSHYNKSELTQHNQNLTQVTDKSPTSQVQLYLCLLIAIAVVPLLIHNQAITGVFVNFILIFTCLKIGIRSAVSLAFIPSIAAVSSGLFPLPLAPMIPFIIAGNILLVTIIRFFKHNYVISLPIAALAKFALLYSTSHFLAQHFLPEMFLNKVMVMMSWPQFATAMVGGLFAYLVMKGLSISGK